VHWTWSNLGEGLYQEGCGAIFNEGIWQDFGTAWCCWPPEATEEGAWEASLSSTWTEGRINCSWNFAWHHAVSATPTCTSVGLLPCILTFSHGISPSTLQTTPSRLSGLPPPCVTAQATMRLHHASALYLLHIAFLPWFLALQLSVTTVQSSTTTMVHQRPPRTSKLHLPACILHTVASHSTLHRNTSKTPS